MSADNPVYSAKERAMIREWIEAVTNTRLAAPDDLYASLKDGVALSM